MYTLIKEDWRGLGSPMGTERTRVVWRKNFMRLENAKDEAVYDHGKEIAWKSTGRDVWFSGDLSSHAYYIVPLKFEPTLRYTPPL